MRTRRSDRRRSTPPDLLGRLLHLIATFIIISTTANPSSTGAENKARNTTKPCRPNLVIILADDLGWTDVGCFGARYYETPQIDRLAAGGLRFTCAYTNGPNCAPTRAALLSGQYGPRTGVYTVGVGARGLEMHRRMIPADNVTDLPLDKVTLPEALKAAGYATGMFGKWHLGNDARHRPSARGFDEAIESSGRHFGFQTDPPSDAKPGEYLADFLTRHAESFLQRNKDRPFFLYLAHFAVHVPLEAKPELTAKYRRKTPDGRHNHPTYAAMIESLDASVGRIVAKLESLGLAENTIVVFFSDNGGVGGYRELGGSDGTTDNAPLRGGKGMLYEGGVRVPMIVRWPRSIRPGSVCDVPVIGIDFYPTFLEAAGIRPKHDYVLDGTSLLPLWKSNGLGTLPREALYWHFPGYLEHDIARGIWRTTPAGAIRRGDYKLLEFFETGRIELYNLRNDLGQRRDLAAQEPEVAGQMQQGLARWRQTIGAPMPKPRNDPVGR